mmetsp:Transcript_110922/g.292972  ORF Transcript_110922/g.292972 Transcript_110922/m.292972 type:complete len:242 (+) Transcript_110922:1127-1852(+)
MDLGWLDVRLHEHPVDVLVWARAPRAAPGAREGQLCGALLAARPVLLGVVRRVAAGPRMLEGLLQVARELRGVLAHVAVELRPLGARPEVRVRARDPGRGGAADELEQHPLLGGGLRVAGEVGDHRVVAAAELALRPLAWLDADDVHAIEIARQLDHFAAVDLVDDVLIEDVVPLTMGDRVKHTHEDCKVWLVDHHPAVVLVLTVSMGNVLATVHRHRDVAEVHAIVHRCGGATIKEIPNL